MNSERDDTVRNVFLPLHITKSSITKLKPSKQAEAKYPGPTTRLLRLPFPRTVSLLAATLRPRGFQISVPIVAIPIIIARVIAILVVIVGSVRMMLTR